jgi:hypothetical protein
VAGAGASIVFTPDFSWFARIFPLAGYLALWKIRRWTVKTVGSNNPPDFGRPFP